jgi:hypothetical protein
MSGPLRLLGEQEGRVHEGVVLARVRQSALMYLHLALEACMRERLDVLLPATEAFDVWLRAGLFLSRRLQIVV